MAEGLTDWLEAGFGFPASRRRSAAEQARSLDGEALTDLKANRPGTGAVMKAAVGYLIGNRDIGFAKNTAFSVLKWSSFLKWCGYSAAGQPAFSTQPLVACVYLHIDTMFTTKGTFR